MNELMKLVLENPQCHETIKTLNVTTHIKVIHSVSGGNILEVVVVDLSGVTIKTTTVQLTNDELRVSHLNPELTIGLDDGANENVPNYLESLKIREFLSKDDRLSQSRYVVQFSDFKGNLVEYKYGRFFNTLLEKYILIRDFIAAADSSSAFSLELLKCMKANIDAINALAYYLNLEYRNLVPIRHNAGYILTYHKTTDDGFNIGNLVAKRTTANNRYKLSINIDDTLFDVKLVKTDMFDLLHTVVGTELDYITVFKNSFKAFMHNAYMRRDSNEGENFLKTTLTYDESRKMLCIKDRVIDDISDTTKTIEFNSKSFISPTTASIFSGQDGEDINSTYVRVDNFNSCVNDPEIEYLLDGRRSYWHLRLLS